ncbi:hypothetical protein [Labrys neptuniae]
MKARVLVEGPIGPDVVASDLAVERKPRSVVNFRKSRRNIRRSHKLEVRKNELTRFLRDAEEPPPLQHPNMAAHYRTQVEGLYSALQDDSRGERIAAAEQIRSLMKEIVLTPADGELQIDVRGDLAGILTLSAQTKNPAACATGSQLKMIAGDRNQILRHRTPQCPNPPFPARNYCVDEW